MNVTELGDRPEFWLRRYAERGMSMVVNYGLIEKDGALVCACGKADCTGSAGKHPVRGAWQKTASTNLDDVLAQIQGKPRNVGIAMGHGLVTLDVDGEEGRASLAGLEAQYGALPVGARQVTGSGGLHLVFRTREAFKNSAKKIRPSLDVRGANGQIVVAPSQHRSGGFYTWTDWDLGFPELPDWLGELFRGSAKVETWDMEAWLATREASVQGDGGNHVMMATMGKIVRAGRVRSAERALEVLAGWNARCVPAWSDAELVRAFEKVWSGVIEEGDAKVTLPLNEKGRPFARSGDMHDILTCDPKYIGAIQANVRKGGMTIDDVVAEEEEVTRLAIDVERRYGVPLEYSAFSRVVRAVGKAVQRDPVVEYLDSVALKWTHGMESVIADVPVAILGVEATPLTVAMLRCFFISAVARAYEPGCPVHSSFVLAGAQGCGKSSFFSILGGPWFDDTAIDLRSKDRFEKMGKAWIYEWAELTALSSYDQNAVKGFMTSNTDTFRRPYSRAEEQRPRRGVICGTTNEERYLVDSTGSRRFHTIVIPEGRRIDIHLLKEVRDFLWAEAVMAYRAGESCFLSKELNELREEMAQDQTVEDAVYDRAVRKLVGRGPEAWATPVSYQWLMEECDLPKTLRSHRSVSKAMRDLGYTLHRKGKSRINVYSTDQPYPRD